MGTTNSSLRTLALADGDPVAQTNGTDGRPDVSTRSTVVMVQPAVSLAAYAAEDGVGSVQDYTSALTETKKSGLLTNVTVIDKSKQNAALTIFFFNISPAAGLSADNAALSVAADIMLTNCIGQVSISASDYSATALASVATKACSMVLTSASTSVWAVMKTTGTPTYATVDALKIKLGIQQD